MVTTGALHCSRMLVSFLYFFDRCSLLFQTHFPWMLLLNFYCIWRGAGRASIQERFNQTNFIQSLEVGTIKVPFVSVWYVLIFSTSSKIYSAPCNQHNTRSVFKIRLYQKQNRHFRSTERFGQIDYIIGCYVLYAVYVICRPDISISFCDLIYVVNLWMGWIPNRVVFIKLYLPNEEQYDGLLQVMFTI